MVKSIPLCLTEQPDELIWPHSANGAYTVKMGYWFLKMEFSKPTTGSVRTFDAQATVERDMESQCTKQSEEFSLASFKKLPPHKAELRQKKGSKRGPL